MTKTLCPDGCGKKFISAAYAELHADVNHIGWREPKNTKKKGWATPYGFVDFGEPVTYEQACATAMKLSDAFEVKAT